MHDYYRCKLVMLYFSIFRNLSLHRIRNLRWTFPLIVNRDCDNLTACEVMCEWYEDKCNANLDHHLQREQHREEVVGNGQKLSFLYTQSSKLQNSYHTSKRWTNESSSSSSSFYRVTCERLGVTERLGETGRFVFNGGFVCWFIVPKCGELDNPHGLSMVSAASPETTTCVEARSSVPGMSSL